MNKIRMQTSSFVIFFVLLAVALCACAQSGGVEEQGGTFVEETRVARTDDSGGIEQDPTGGEPLLLDTTKVVAGAAMDALQAVAPDGTLAFIADTAEAETFLAALQPGDVLASDVSSLAPDGFLRKVVSVSSDGQQYAVETDQATLEDAILQGTFKFSAELTADDLAAAIPAGKESTRPLARPSRAGGMIPINIGRQELIDQVFVSGKAEIKVKPDLEIPFDGAQIQAVHFTTEASERVELDLEANVAYGQVQEQLTVKEIPLRTFTVQFGGLPVVVRPWIELVVGVRGRVSAGMTTGIVHQGDLTTGVHYVKGDGWNAKPVTFKPTFEAKSTQPKASASVIAYAGPVLKLSLYGVKGPYLMADGYLDLSSDPAVTPWWTLNGGFEASVGVQIKILGKSLPPLSMVLYNQTWPITDAGGPAPGVAVAQPPEPQAAGGDGGEAAEPDDDGDSLSDAEEQSLGTDPRSPDTDGDGVEDRTEVDQGTDPLHPPPPAAEPEPTDTPRPPEPEPITTPQLGEAVARCRITEDVNIRAEPRVSGDNVVATVLGGEYVPVSGWTLTPSLAVWYHVPLEGVNLYARFMDNQAGWISKIDDYGKLFVDCPDPDVLPELPYPG